MGENLKNVWWNDVVKATVQSKETAWKKVLGANNEVKDRCMEIYKEEKRKIK